MLKLKDFYHNFVEFTTAADYLIDKIKLSQYDRPVIKDEELFRSTVKFFYNKMLETKYRIFYSKLLDMAGNAAGKRIHVIDLDCVVFENNDPRFILEIKSTPYSDITIPRHQLCDLVNLQQVIEIPLYLLVKVPQGKYRFFEVEKLSTIADIAEGRWVELPLKLGIELNRVMLINELKRMMKVEM